MTSPTPKRTDPLSRAEIARAALGMVDRDGVDKFSMRRLANELGVTTMAVYHHFQNKAEVLQAAADQVWIEVVQSYEPQDDAVEDLIQGVLTTRRVFNRHPDITPYCVASPTTEDAVHVVALGLAEQFEQAGLTERLAADAYFVIGTYTLGSALLHSRRTVVDRSIRGPVSDLASLAPDAPAGTNETYRLIREAMEDDVELARFERGCHGVRPMKASSLVWTSASSGTSTRGPY